MKETSELFKALADETRLRIIALLLDGGEYCVCDIMEGLALPQSTVSRHLAYLKNSGWVEGRRQNKWMYYRLHRRPSSLMAAIIAALGRNLHHIPACQADQERLQAYLKHKKTITCD